MSSNLKLLMLSTAVPSMKTGSWISGFPFPKSAIGSLVLLTLRVRLLFWRHPIRLLIPLRVLWFIAILYSSVNGVLSANFKMVLELWFDYTVMGIERVEQETDHIALRSSCVDGYWRGSAASLYWLWSANEEAKDVVSLGRAETRDVEC